MNVILFVAASLTGLAYFVSSSCKQGSKLKNASIARIMAYTF